LLPPVLKLDHRFGVIGNFVMLFLGVSVAPIIFALRPCRSAKYNNAGCRQDTDYHYSRFHWCASFVLDFD
jgi:hypothetical protein